MNTVIKEGYGVCLDGIEFRDMSALKQFVEIHCSRLYKGKLHNVIDHRPEDYSDFNELFSRMEDYKGCGFAEILMDAIYHTYNIWLNVVEGTDGKKYVLFLPCYPWEYDAKDKVLTESSLSEMYRLLMTEMLGYEPDMSCLGYYSVECEQEDTV